MVALTVARPSGRIPIHVLFVFSANTECLNVHDSSWFMMLNGSISHPQRSSPQFFGGQVSSLHQLPLAPNRTIDRQCVICVELLAIDNLIVQMANLDKMNIANRVLAPYRNSANSTENWSQYFAVKSWRANQVEFRSSDTCSQVNFAHCVELICF